MIHIEISGPLKLASTSFIKWVNGQGTMMDYEFSDRLFGDKIEITLYDIEPQLAKPIAEDAYREALRLQKIFNIYDDESELSLLRTEWFAYLS